MQTTNSMMKAPVSLGFEKKEATDLVESMNVLLASLQVHYQKLRNFHWHVVGADFFDLHAFFETEYQAVASQADEIAERIRVLGKRAVGRMHDCLVHSRVLEPMDKAYTSEEMVKEVIEDYERLFELLLETHEKAASSGDLGTADLLASYLRRMEKRHWMLRSFLK